MWDPGRDLQRAPRARVLERETGVYLENHNDVRSAVVAEFEFKAAAAVEGTSSRVRSGILEAPEKVQPGKSNIQFFVKGKVCASTSVVREELQEFLGRVVGVGGQDDVYAMLGDGWTSIPRCLVVASPLIAPCSCFTDSVVGLVKMCLDSGRVRVAMRKVVGLCVHRALGVESFAWMLLHLGMARARGEKKRPLGVEILRRLPVRCRPR